MLLPVGHLQALTALPGCLFRFQDVLTRLFDMTFGFFQLLLRSFVLLQAGQPLAYFIVLLRVVGETGQLAFKLGQCLLLPGGEVLSGQAFLKFYQLFSFLSELVAGRLGLAGLFAQDACPAL